MSVPLIHSAFPANVGVHLGFALYSHEIAILAR